MNNYIILNGQNSNTITGLLIQELPPVSKPKIRTQTEEIDGRDGDIVTKLGYAAYDKEISIGLYGDFDINEIISYFDSEGTVTFSNESDKYYNYQIIDQIDFERLIRFRTATVTFHVQPFKYSTTEEEITDNIDIISGEGTEFTLSPTDGKPFNEIQINGNTEQATVVGQEGVTVSGRSLTLNDVDTSMEDYITLEGNSYQQTSDGKQLLSFLNSTGEMNGVTYTFSTDGTLTLNGTTTGFGVSSGVNLNVVIPFLEGEAYTLTSYYVSGSVTPSSTNNHVLDVSITGSSSSTLISGILNLNSDNYNNNASITNTTTTSGTATKINIQNRTAGTVYDNLVLKFQLEKGSSSSDWEEYTGGVPRPTPDYPSAIETVTGTQTITINSTNYTINLGSIELCMIGDYQDYLYKSDGYWYKTGYIGKIASYNGETITTDYLSTTGELSTGATVYYVLNTPTITEITNSSLITQLDTLYTAALTSNTTITSSFAFVKVNYNHVASLPSPTNVSAIKTVTGNNTINICGKNLLNLTNGTYTASGITAVVNDGEITLNGTASGNSFIGIPTANNLRWKDGTTYTISTFNEVANSNIKLRINQSGSLDITLNAINKSETINYVTTPDILTTSITVRVQSGTTLNNYKFKPMIEQGSVATDYAVYEETSYPINLGTLELCKLNNYQDYLYHNNGTWYKHSQIGKMAVNTNDITLITSYSNITYAQIPKPVDEITYGTYQGVPVLCTHAIYSYGPSNWDTTNGIGYIYTQAMSTSYWIGFPKGTTLNEVQSLLSGCVIYYVLATETDTEITDTTLSPQLEALDGATSYEGSTTFTSNYSTNNAQMILVANVYESNSVTVTNSGNTVSKPTFTIYGHGDIGIYLNDNQMFNIVLGTEEYITIDIANMEASKDSVLKNRLVTGDYDGFVLNPGENVISFSGTVTQIIIENYSRWI